MFFEALIPISLFVGSFVMIIAVTYITRTASHRERMAMIEKGMDPSSLDKKSRKKVRATKSRRSLKLGMIAVAMGMGLFIASVLDGLFNMGETIYFAMLLLFGGTSLILYYSYVEKKTKEEEEDERFLRDFEERNKDEDLV